MTSNEQKEQEATALTEENGRRIMELSLSEMRSLIHYLGERGIVMSVQFMMPPYFPHSYFTGGPEQQRQDG